MLRRGGQHGRPADDPRRGFTLLEVMIATGLVALALGSALNVWFHSQVAFTDNIRQNVIAETGHRVLSRIGAELMEAEPLTLLPLSVTDSDFVQFQKVEGYDAGSKVLGPVITLGFQLEAGERANGADDNGDGRIDEGYVTYTELGSPAIGIGGNVLRLRFDGLSNGIRITVNVGIVDRSGLLVEDTFTRVIAFRNGA